jgi:hypothetical protein
VKTAITQDGMKGLQTKVLRSGHLLFGFKVREQRLVLVAKARKGRSLANAHRDKLDHAFAKLRRDDVIVFGDQTNGR